MKPSRAKKAEELCESILQGEIAYNSENEILPSESEIAERLLANSLSMKCVYVEVYDKLQADYSKISCLLRSFLSVAAFWSPGKNESARAARIEIGDTNRKIARLATELSGLIDRRTELHDSSGFSSNTHYHVCDVIDAAATKVPEFHSYVSDHLKSLAAEFDLKYWPSLSDFMRALSVDALEADVVATDSITESATRSTRTSKADYFRALLTMIEENVTATNEGFRLSDKALAIIGNCALDFDPDEMVDEAYVKRLRQRARGG